MSLRLSSLRHQAVNVSNFKEYPTLLAELQQALYKLGLYPGPVDGLWGELSAQAIQTFCARLGLNNWERGWFGADFLQALQTALGPAFSSVTGDPLSDAPIPLGKPTPAPGAGAKASASEVAIPGQGNVPVRGLTYADFQRVAQAILVPVAALQAVVAVEASGSGFWDDGRPKMRYERHIFHQRTKGRYSNAHPDISNPKSGGSKTGPEEYNRLRAAMQLDEEAGLLSASWGLPQIMGFNYQLAGYANVKAMVWAMHQSEAKQLEAMGRFLVNTNITQPMREQNWAQVARLYNGRDYRKNRYDEKLAMAFQQALQRTA